MKINRLFLILGLCATLYSCGDSSKEEIIPVSSGTYILNNGNWGSNDSSIGIYSPSDKRFTADAFMAVNGQALGDLGQDMIRLGEDVYISVNGSQTIFVTDTDLKIIHQINAESVGTRLSPKYLGIGDNKVYVTFYEGYLGEIASDYSIRLCPVGPNPEGIAVAGNNIFVANSGGMAHPIYNNTVSVVSASEFIEISTIEVNVNPAKVEASSDGAYVFVSSFGNYADIPAKLQVISVADGAVSDLEYSSVSAIAKGPGDLLYVLCGGYDEYWNPLPGTVYMHDMKTNRPLGTFVTDGTAMPKAYSISATPDGYIYVGCSDYTNTGDIFVFTSDGKLHDRFDSQGLNPLKAY